MFYSNSKKTDDVVFQASDCIFYSCDGIFSISVSNGFCLATSVDGTGCGGGGGCV